MKNKIILILFAAAIIFTLGVSAVLSEEKGVSAADAGDIMRKLDEIGANQTQILKQLAEIKQELSVIKVRATR